MITFKINGAKHNIPTTWSDVTYEQYIYHIIPRTFAETISCFSGIPRGTIETSKIKGLEMISLAIAFMTLTPKFELTPMVGKYVLPQDITFESVGQFEDLRSLIKRLPKKTMDQFEYEDWETYSELCLEAASIYVQKVRDGKYDYRKVAGIKEELRSAPCTEVIGSGTFFLSRPLNISMPTLNLFQRVTRLLKRKIQDLPGYRKTLDFLLRSSK